MSGNGSRELRDPHVTVCVPTYNRPEALARVVESLLAQTYRNIDIVVTDDGDSDATRKALGSLLDRIRYEANPSRLGIYGNWNRGITLAKGELVATYHDHDEYAPTIVERSVELFRSHPNVGVAHVGVRVVEPDGSSQSTVHQDIDAVTDGRRFAQRQSWKWGSYVAHGSIMVRHALYERLGPFDERCGIAADMDMLVRFCMECDIGYVRAPLYGCRRRMPSDPLSRFDWKDLDDYIRVRRLNFERLYDQPWSLQMALSTLRLQVDVRATKELLGLLVRNRPELVEEGLSLIEREGTAVGLAVAKQMTRKSAACDALRSSSYAGYRAYRRLRAPRERRPS